MVVQREVILDIANNINVEKRNHIFKIKMTENQKLTAYCLGIFICYFYYGVLQEKITRVPYGEEKFTYQQTLVFAQCCVNVLFAYIIIKTTQTQNEVDTTPTLMYVFCTLSYMGAMLASNTALRYINYPTQVLGKSCKPIPVMILGVLIARKRYPLIKYISVLLIVIGVALFLYKDKQSKKMEGSAYGYGELLLIVSLTLDGMTGAFQDKMRVGHKTSAYNFMLQMNKYSVIFLGPAILLSGEIFEFFAFTSRYPHVILNVALFSLTSALGQNFIFLTVAQFGPLTCSLVTTTRKFFTILFSVLFFGNALIGRQWVAVLVVFTGLGIDALYGKKRPGS